jgi:hypothetical protein
VGCPWRPPAVTENVYRTHVRTETTRRLAPKSALEPCRGTQIEAWPWPEWQTTTSLRPMSHQRWRPSTAVRPPFHRRALVWALALTRAPQSTKGQNNESHSTSPTHCPSRCRGSGIHVAARVGRNGSKPGQALLRHRRSRGIASHSAPEFAGNRPLLGVANDPVACHRPSARSQIGVLAVAVPATARRPGRLELSGPSELSTL